MESLDVCLQNKPSTSPDISVQKTFCCFAIFCHFSYYKCSPWIILACGVRSKQTHDFVGSSVCRYWELLILQILLCVIYQVNLCCSACICSEIIFTHPCSLVSQLLEWPGQDLPVELRPHSAGRVAYTCEDHWHRGNSLHLQRSLLQVSTAVIYLLMASGGLLVP